MYQVIRMNDSDQIFLDSPYQLVVGDEVKHKDKYHIITKRTYEPASNRMVLTTIKKETQNENN